MLWFDVESKYEATVQLMAAPQPQLWFDVESKYEATLAKSIPISSMLWFDVESKYEATDFRIDFIVMGCGLM